jgi:hypothetical protein
VPQTVDTLIVGRRVLLEDGLRETCLAIANGVVAGHGALTQENRETIAEVGEMIRAGTSSRLIRCRWRMIARVPIRVEAAARRRAPASWRAVGSSSSNFGWSCSGKWEARRAHSGSSVRRD